MKYCATAADPHSTRQFFSSAPVQTSKKEKLVKIFLVHVSFRANILLVTHQRAEK